MEGEGKAKRASAASVGITDDEMAWLKNTRWLWNNWREVIFKGDGTFLAPAENCEREGNPKCRWSAADDRISVECAPCATLSHATHGPAASVHKLTACLALDAPAGLVVLASTRSRRQPTSRRFRALAIRTATLCKRSAWAECHVSHLALWAVVCSVSGCAASSVCAPANARLEM